MKRLGEEVVRDEGILDMLDNSCYYHFLSQPMTSIISGGVRRSQRFSHCHCRHIQGGLTKRSEVVELRTRQMGAYNSAVID